MQPKTKPIPVRPKKLTKEEFLQQWVPGRLPDPSDFAALLIGAALVQAAPRLDLRTGRP